MWSRVHAHIKPSLSWFVCSTTLLNSYRSRLLNWQWNLVFFFFFLNWAFSQCNCTQYRRGPLNKSTAEMNFEAHYFLVFNNIILFIKQLLYTFTTSMVTKRDNLFSVSLKPQQILLLFWGGRCDCVQ